MNRKKDMKTSITAGGIVVNNENQICLVRDTCNNICIPKGRKEEGENLLETAKREIYEETGLKEIMFVKKLDVIKRPNLVIKDEMKEIHVFLFKSISGMIKKMEEDETPDWYDFDKAVFLL